MGACSSKFFSKTGFSHPEYDSDSDWEGEFGGGNVQLIKTVKAWDAKLLEANRRRKILIVNFSSKCCRPCKLMTPSYQELSIKYPSMMFLVIDVDEIPEVGISWDIKATPTFFFLKEGQIIDKFIGANKSELDKKISNIADAVP